MTQMTQMTQMTVALHRPRDVDTYIHTQFNSIENIENIENIYIYIYA